MTRMWTPPTVSRELRQATMLREAMAAEGLKQEREKWVDDFNRDLDRIWQGMRLVWCPDPAPVEAVAMGAKPGRWGILMPSQTGGPASVKPIVGPDECFVDPSMNASMIFDTLRRSDMWNSEVRADRRRAEREAERAAEKRKQEEREERTQDILERYLAGTRTQVSMNRDTPWAQNAAGYNRIKGSKK